MFIIFHNNFNTKYKYPFGAVEENQKVYFRLDVDREYKHCVVRLWTAQQKEEIHKMIYRDHYYEVEISINSVGLNWYFFIIEDFDRQFKFYACEGTYTAGNGTVYTEYPLRQAFQITCYNKNFHVPNWLQEGIMYQIFPDRFCRDYSYKFDTRKYRFIHKNWNEKLGHTLYGADNFEYYGGNILGIMNKISYIKDLGINKIYLNPIFKSKSNHRYDASNYLEIDEMIGLVDDFKNFIDICHKNDIKVIIDVSWNHVGDDSVYFNKYKNFGEDGAYNNRNSNYAKWFFIDENNKYNSWWGIDTLPVLNKSNNDYKNHVEQAVKLWSSYGIDGFRLDVIDELPDEFLRWFRDIVKGNNKELAIIGEVWDDATLKKDGNGTFREYLYGNSQDSVMNYCLRNLIIDFLAYGKKEKETWHENIDGYTFYRKYMNLLNNYPKQSMYSAMNFLSTHDISRIMTVFSETPYSETLSKEDQGNFIIPEDKYLLGIKRLKIAWSFIICSIGIPCIFYGDEIGIDGYNDPFNRKPMQWDLSDLDIQTLNWFKDINKLRTDCNLLNKGDIEFIYVDTDVISFSRRYNNEELIYIMNRSIDKKDIVIKDKNMSIDGLSYKIIHNT